MASDKKETKVWVDEILREELDRDWENARRARLAKEEFEKRRREQKRKDAEMCAQEQREIAETREKLYRSAIRHANSANGFWMDTVSLLRIDTEFVEVNNDEFDM